MNKKRLVLLVIIIAGIWFFWGKDKAPDNSKDEAQEAKTEESASTSPSTVPEGETVSSGKGLVDGKALVHYFPKDKIGACSSETITLAQAVDLKYGHPAAGALVAQTLSLPVSAQGTHASALLAGTRLLSMRLDKEGVAHVDYNAKLLEGLSDCNKPQRRAQIERTLKEFSEIKSVVITVDGKVWE